MKKRLIAACMVIAWATILVKVMVFKDLPVLTIGSVIFNFGGTHEGPANLIPFKTILPYLLNKKGFIIAFINLAGNIVLLIPIGCLIPFVYRSITWNKSLVLGIAAGLVIEGMQAMFHVGIFDIDDILLNATGVLFGYWAFLMFKKAVHLLRPVTLIITTIVLIAIATAVAFYFVDVYQQRRLPEHLQPVAINNKADTIDKAQDGVAQGPDPCGGTGGTGQIVSVGNSSITIKLNNDASKIIHLTDKTKIKSSLVLLSLSDLKPGDRIAVVIDGSDTAALILVCNDAGHQPREINN